MVTHHMTLDDAKQALVCAEQDLESIKIEANYEPSDENSRHLSEIEDWVTFCKNRVSALEIYAVEEVDPSKN